MESMLNGSIRNVPAAVGAAGLLLIGAACDGGPTGPEGSGAVALSVTTAGGGDGAAASLTPTLSVEQSDGQGNALVLDSVQVVLREIELERMNDDDCDDVPEASDDDCEEFEAGIRLLHLPLDGSVEQLVQIRPPADVYDELEFEIHKPDDDDQEGRDFIAEHPNFEDVSVRVKGTFNGEEFLFLQDLNEEQEIELSPPLEVGPDAGPVNVTLRLDVTTWFVAADGSLVDPTSANEGGPNENLVEENIENAIEAFEDDDRDGDDDDDDDSDDGS
jgi:hypothetical protein